jgi:hypothetical protein
MRSDCHQQCADQHPQIRQDQSCPQHRANRLLVGAQPAGEQDQRQRQHADRLRQPGVIEVDAERTVGTGEHSDCQEEQRRRQSKPERCFSGNDTEDQKQRCDRQDEFKRHWYNLPGCDSLASPGVTPQTSGE